MYPRVVIAPESLVDFLRQLAQRLEPIGIAEVHFKLAIERFLIAILPETSGTIARYRDVTLLKKGHRIANEVKADIIRRVKE